MREYNKEKEPILEKYNSSAAKFYAKQLSYSAKGMPYDELAPPKNNTEKMERAAK
jgi:hypothetical protein